MSQKPSPRLQLRIFLGSSVAIGPGKAELLAAVAETGSISAAGRSMGMSYKKAWYLLDTMNRCFQTPLVEASRGGKGFGGARVTPMGAEVLARYRSIQTRAAIAFADDLEALNALVADEPPEAD
ncbi:winged helix-turn-helix domain-containing protein [Bosea sp. 124]|uniref:winged helix-turn-helix domain-containing protein n=1 Tax=Bosea sp. 124 TaxID=2135642 RepID=UPI000D3A1A78|nr:winged helix-turn-helix domain-containing protein [Bosea sp. 124]PTM41529.1 molybdate transport system regulatory protein [Bosea sp. 124]